MSAAEAPTCDHCCQPMQEHKRGVRRRVVTAFYRCEPCGLTQRVALGPEDFPTERKPMHTNAVEPIDISEVDLNNKRSPWPAVYVLGAHCSHCSGDRMVRVDSYLGMREKRYTLRCVACNELTYLAQPRRR